MTTITHRYQDCEAALHGLVSFYETHKNKLGTFKISCIYKDQILYLDCNDSFNCSRISLYIVTPTRFETKRIETFLHKNGIIPTHTYYTHPSAHLVNQMDKNIEGEIRNMIRKKNGGNTNLGSCKEKDQDYDGSDEWSSDEDLKTTQQ